MLIIGDVVALGRELGWYEGLPLYGRTVLVTRTRTQASELSAALAERGAEVIEAATIAVAPPDDRAPADAALGRAGDFDWLALTSPNGVAAVFDRLAALGLDARALAGVRVAAVGPGTANALRERGVRADLVPRTYTTEALGEALVAAGASGGARVLLARADIATDALPRRLAEAGARVEQVSVYRTVRPDALPDAAAEALADGRVDWVTFTSSSTVENFRALAGGVDLSRVKLAAIGPVTAEALRAAGWAPAVVAEPHTIPALANAIARAEAGR